MEPKFIISKKVVLEKYNEIKQLADVVSYSSKTNPLITNILEYNTSSMFSVHLFNELKNIKDKSRIIFLAQAWTYELINNLICKGIKWFVVDNESDLDILIEFLRNNTNESIQKINLLLRLRLKENTVRTEKHFVFGMYSNVINKRINEISKDKLLREKIHTLGAHFHRKTQNMAEWNLVYELENDLTEQTLDLIDVINIGGGLPSEYANTNTKVIHIIKNKILELRKFLNNKSIKLMIEPGRVISAPSTRLITEIIGIYDNNIIVNASVYNTDLDALIVPVKLKVKDEYFKEETDIEIEKKKKNIQAYTIKGMTPCSLDLFRYRVYLEKKKIGDKIIFLNAGAYNFSSEFCNLKQLESEIVEDFDSQELKQKDITFMNLPEEYSNDKSDFLVINIPWEKDVSFGIGASKGPKEIIKASHQLEYFDVETEKEVFEKGIRVINIKPERFSDIFEQVSKIKIKNKFPVFLGGDHSITIATAKVMEKENNDFDVIVFDAHADYFYSWNASENNHRCVNRRLINKHNILMAGLRSCDNEEFEQMNKDKNIDYIKSKDFDIDIFKEKIKSLKKNIYISLDVDVFDPAFIKNTGTPEPGGMTWKNIIKALETIFQEKNLIAADIVEFAPTNDYEKEAYYLAKLIYKLFTFASFNKSAE